MSRYVDFIVGVTKLLQFDKIKEVSDLSNAILADGVGFGYKKMLYKRHMKESYAFKKINEINWSKYIGNIEFFYYNLKKKKTCVCLFTLQRIRRRPDEI